jgi:hypothetical protein
VMEGGRLMEKEVMEEEGTEGRGPGRFATT